MNMGAWRWTVLGELLCAVAVPAMAQRIYTCTDAKGRRLTSDRPIAECNDRVQNEVSPSGVVRRQIQPSLTAEERAAEEVKARKAAEARALEAEDRKRERALLDRYPNRAAHDKERATALAPTDEVFKAAQARTAELEAQRKRLDEEAAFYKRDPNKLPPALKRQVEDNALQAAAHKRSLAGIDEERKRINLRFDDELDQLRRLWALQGKTQASK